MALSNKRLLVANFFPAFFPPNSGGEQRLFYLFSHLSRRFDVTLLTSTYPNTRREIIAFGEHFREYRVPKEHAHLAQHTRLQAEGIGQECSGIVHALAEPAERGFGAAFRELTPDADIIVHNFPFTLPYDRGFGIDERPRIYNSENVESLLAGSVFGGGWRDLRVAQITDLERRMVRHSDLVSAASPDDQTNHIELYGCDPKQTIVTPNGFEPADGQPDEAPRGLNVPFVLFLGSAHPPNVEAAAFIAQELAPATPGITYVLAGSVCNHITRRSPNLKLAGIVSERVRLWLLRNCVVAINTVQTGSGTNLKTLDYLGAGALTLTTAFGARGLNLRPGFHCIVAPREQFAQELTWLVTRPELRDSIGMAGRRWVFEHFSWSRIADNFAEHLTSLRRPSIHPVEYPLKPRLLVLNDYPISVPRGGGEFRMWNLYRRLGRKFDITLLCLTASEAGSELQLAEGLRQIAVPKTKQHIRLEQAVNEGSHVSANDIVAGLYCELNSALTRCFRNLLQTADAIVCSHPYMSPLLERAGRQLPVIYEAQNVEADMKAAMLDRHRFFPELIGTVRRLEAYASSLARAIIAVSPEDAQLHSAAHPNTPVFVIRNGVEIPMADATPRSNPTDESFRAVFIGSSHLPNIEAAEFITHQLAPLLPTIVFHLVGGVCDAIRPDNLPPNVICHGFVSDTAKHDLLRRAHVGLNPMSSGGGSNLKLGEFFAAGVPVLSTPFGSRGYDVQPDVQVCVAELHEFANRLTELRTDPALRARIAANGREYAVAALDWDVLADQYAALLAPLLPTGSGDRRRRSLLAVTYRFTDPPRGGAEVALMEILRSLNTIGDFDIDVAATDVLDIRNKYHFSSDCISAEGNPAALKPSFLRNSFSFGTDPPAVEHTKAVASRLFDQWSEESISQARSFLPRFTSTLLMGGWHLLEKQGNLEARWSGAVAEIFIASGADSVVVEGYAPEAQPLRITDGSLAELCDGVVEGGFRIEVPVGGQSAVLTLHTHAPARSIEDARRLGVRLERLTTMTGSKTSDIPLAEDFEHFMRIRHPAEWVESLIQIAQDRPVEIDTDFIRIRGPHSAEMERFIVQHAREYDCILVQGVPFSTSVSIGTLVKEAGRPLIVLPHVHMDDRYYHWRSFYDLFRSADLSIAAPFIAKDMFFDRIGATSVALPGGGVDEAEFSDLSAAVVSWRRLYSSQTPFVLVLGRKTGAKRYREVIDAIKLLRQQGIKIDVVLIGPDEDEAAVAEPFAHVLGSQPRTIVLGALASCLCVVNMSESESFGIVVAEAWMCGRPVIVSSGCAAFREIVDEGVNGFLCASSAEVALRIRDLLKDNTLASTLGHNGQQTARNRYTWNSIAAQLNEELLKLTSSEWQAGIS